MSYLIDKIKRMNNTVYKLILTLTLLIIFIIVSYLAIQYLKQKYMKKDGLMNDIANANTRNEAKEAVVRFFHVDWCPHCKTALPEWNTFKAQMNNTKIHNYTIKCIEHNCTDDNDSKIKELLDKYEIESYPTVKLVKDEQILDFDSKITKNTLTSFLNVMLK